MNDNPISPGYEARPEGAPSQAPARDGVRVATAKAGPAVAHLERKSDGSLVARFTDKPAGELPMDIQNSPRTTDAPRPGKAVEDVAVLPDEPSVWEATTEDDEGVAAKTTGATSREV